MTPPIRYEVRPYRDEDEEGVRGLLARSLGDGPLGERSLEFFRWKHLQNPFGRSLMLVAEHTNGSIIGLRAFMRWMFRAGPRIYRAVRAVDTATDPTFQGEGVFSRLTLAAIEQLRRDTDFIFNTPNEKSLPGYLKMGWCVVGKLPISVRVTRPAALAWHLLSPPDRLQAGPAADVSIPSTATRQPDDNRLTTARSIDYLDWRYLQLRALGYRSVQHASGIAFYRLRRRGRFCEAMLTDALSSEEADVPALVRRVCRRAHADYVSAFFSRGTVQHRALRRTGFVPVWKGPTLVARLLTTHVDPDPMNVRSWSLTTGDLELF